MQVTRSIPVAVAYEHIHFGDLGKPRRCRKGWRLRKLTDLGIGFVQNIGDSGMTDRLGIGKATYEGDWVANVLQAKRHERGTGAINPEDGDATLVANFDTEKFTGTLTGLATLTGTLDGNGFSGMTATVERNHADLDASGTTFAGEFSGGIYGDKGEEAAGVFDFDGGEAGAFVGAFGGHESGLADRHLGSLSATTAPGPATGRAPFSYPVEEE